MSVQNECLTINADKNALTCILGKDVKPVVKVTLPTTIVFHTIDTFYGGIKKETDTLAELDYSTINPCNGPVYFEGLKPGDVLEVKVNKIKCTSPGAALLCPKEGVLGSYIDAPVTKILHWDEDNNVRITDEYTMKATPVIGVMGVAPDGEPVRTIEAGDHGGNMDTTLLCEGATVYLPIRIEGGLFCTGDLHQAQGDGESSYTGLESSGQIELSFNVRRDIKMDIPFVKSKGVFASIATEATTDAALKKAMYKLANFMVDNGNVSFTDATFITGLFADLQISQVVDPVKTARMAMPIEEMRKVLTIEI